MFLFNETFSINEDKTSKFEKLGFQYILVDYPSSGEILKHTTYGRIATRGGINLQIDGYKMKKQAK